MYKPMISEQVGFEICQAFELRQLNPLLVLGLSWNEESANSS